MQSNRQILGLQYLALIVLGGWLFFKGVVPGWTSVHSDFGNYYVSARLVSTGADLDSLYNDKWFHNQMINMGVNTPGKFSPFPPITSWMLIPYSGLEPLTAQRLFVVVNLAFVMMCAFAWSKVSRWKYMSSLLVVLAGGTSLVNNIAFGQIYLVMTTCLLISILLIEWDKPLLAGILIGAFTVIKYFPAIIIAGLFVLALINTEPTRRRYQLTVVFSLLTAILLFIAQLLFFGTNIMKEYVFSALLPHLSSELSGQGMYSYLFQSWDSLGRNLLVYDAVANPNPIIDWPSGKFYLKAFVAMLVLTTTVAVMYLNSSITSTRASVIIAMPAVAALVILPASATYHYILLLVPLALLLREGVIPKRSKSLLVVIYCAIGFIPYALVFQFAEIAGLIFAYPRLWLVCTFFVATVWALTRHPKSALAQ